MIHVSQEQAEACRRRLMRHVDADAALDEAGFGHLDTGVDFNVRPISEEWRLVGRKPAYRTARANVAYIWRDSDGEDRFGPMPLWFAQRRYDLRAAGLILPNNAPAWAYAGYELWDRVDTATAKTGDSTAVSAWHIVAGLSADVGPAWWEWLVRTYIKQELTPRGAPVAYAVHALRAHGGDWAIAPHAHIVVGARRFRSGARHGERVPSWAGSWQQHWRLEQAWRQLSGLARIREGKNVDARYTAPWIARSLKS